MQNFLLYGANGYTGQLIAEEALRKNVPFLAAGRTENKVKPLAEGWGVECRIFGLDEPGVIDEHLQDIPLLLNAAGPFSRTARPLMGACLRTGTHYLDITGEIETFELAHTLAQAAPQAGVVLLPGAGFDVVPTDSLAYYLKQQLPDATHLKLAFAMRGAGPSRGTAITAVDNLDRPGAVRREGRITAVPPAHDSLDFEAAGRTWHAVAIPWGDVSTAYYTTGIPNITTYMGAPPSTARLLRLQRYLGWLLRQSWVKKFLKKRIDRGPAGPNEEERAQSNSVVWGEVKNEQGETRRAWMETPNGYTLTAQASVLIAQKVMAGKAAVGFQTPAGAFGLKLAQELGMEPGPLVQK